MSVQGGAARDAGFAEPSGSARGRAGGDMSLSPLLISSLHFPA